VERSIAEQMSNTKSKKGSPKKNRKIKLRTLRIEKKPAPITSLSSAVYELAGIHTHTVDDVAAE
jgi:hypothetical protein